MESLSGRNASGWERRSVLAAVAATAAAPTQVLAAPLPFNTYIMGAVEKLAQERAGGGYDLSCAFTRDLDYGGATVRATPPAKQPKTKTMCVAAVAEIMIEAINQYARDKRDSQGNPDPTAYRKLVAAHWQTAKVTSLRTYLFMQPDTRDIFRHPRGTVPRMKDSRGVYVSALSRGTAHALSIFRMGNEVAFKDLRKGDFVNLNRSGGSGHATVFISYIDKDNRHSDTYSPDCLGFQYFSAQGKGRPDAGFAYRDAYFGAGMATTPKWPRDRNVIKSSNQLLLNCGRMWMPADWNTKAALDEINARMLGVFTGTDRTTRAALALDELVEDTLVRFTDEDEG